MKGVIIIKMRSTTPYYTCKRCGGGIKSLSLYSGKCVKCRNMEKKMKISRVNDHLLGEVIAMKIKKELNDKEDYVQNIIDKVEKIKFR